MGTATATMRVNVYAEALRFVDDDEYGPRVRLHTKQVQDEEGKDLAFPHRAIRILIGERVIHAGKKKKPDDDTAAVTFWYTDENQRQMLVKIFEKALEELNRPEAKE